MTVIATTIISNITTIQRFEKSFGAMAKEILDGHEYSLVLCVWSGCELYVWCGQVNISMVAVELV